MMTASTLEETGESRLLRRITALAAKTLTPRIINGIGDDAAVWQPSRSHRSLITTDTLVEGVHFPSEGLTPVQLGHRALAVNLSDLAAKGARPVLVTVALGLRLPVDDAWIIGFYEGLTALACDTGTAVVGGDLVRSAVTTITLTVIGEASPQRIPLRSGARPSDILAVTGSLGASRAGLAALEADLLHEPDARAAFAAFATPQPRLREGRLLAASRSVHAMLDISDGLAIDVHRLIAASQCAAVLDTPLPIAATTTAVAQACGADPEAWALSGGEEYELLVAVAPRSLRLLSQRLFHRCGRALIPIGRCVAGTGLRIRRHEREEELAVLGWDHFSAS